MNMIPHKGHNITVDPLYYYSFLCYKSSMRTVFLFLTLLLTLSGCYRNIQPADPSSPKPSEETQKPILSWAERNVYGRFDDYELRELTHEEKMSLIEQIKAAEGVRYVWGGENPDTGLDCSGLIIWAYGSLGYKGFRKDENVVHDVTAHDMFTYSATSLSAMADTRELLSYETGDFLFFDMNSDGRIDHVAVFISFDETTDTVSVWDASTNTKMVALREIKNILTKNPLIGRPTKLVPRGEGSLTAR